MLKKVIFIALFWEWVPQHSFAICSQKKFMLISVSYNILVESLYIKFQSTNSRFNSNQKKKKSIFGARHCSTLSFHCLWSQSICSVSPSYFWTILWWHHRQYHIWTPTVNLCKICFEAVGVSDLITAFALVCVLSRHSPSFLMTLLPIKCRLTAVRRQNGSHS